MPTHGLRPEDVVVDSRGNAINGAVLEFYTTDVAAIAGTGPIGTATTDGRGRWVFITSYEDDLWVRVAGGSVWRLTYGSAAFTVEGPPGPAGPAGPPGTGGTVYEQASPAATWTVSHGLGRVALVSVVVGGQQVDTDLEVTNTQVIATFPSPTTGYLVIS